MEDKTVRVKFREADEEEIGARGKYTNVMIVQKERLELLTRVIDNVDES